MRRTGFKRKPGSPFSSLTRAAIRRGQKRIVARIKKPTVVEGSKYLAACRDEACYLKFPGCQGGSETIVPCHSNQAKHGKGMGLKADHKYTVPGCMGCHAKLDQSGLAREVKFSTWDRAYERWEPIRARKMGIEIQEAT